MTDPIPLDVVTVLNVDGSARQMPVDHALMTKDWLTQQVDSDGLEIIGCEDDCLTDIDYQPLFYLLVGSNQNSKRNRAADIYCPWTVESCTSYPSYDDPRRKIVQGFFGTVLMVPKALLPKVLPKELVKIVS